MIRKTLFIVAYSFFLLVLADCILFCFPDLWRDESRITIQTEKGKGDCYSSDPRHYFPIRNYSEAYPYCVVYDHMARREGYFPKRKRQAIIVGDSFVFGVGLKEEDTLGYLLSMKYPEINFKNFGVPGSDIRQVHDLVLAALEEEGVRDVIYFYNLNDVLMSAEVHSQQKYIIDFQNIRWHNVKADKSLLSKSTLYTLIRKAIILRKESRLTTQNYLDMYFSPDNKGQLAETKDLFLSMRDILREHGINFCVVIYPLLYKDPLGKYPFLPIHDLLTTFFRENNILCIDAYPAFADYYSLKRFIVNPIDYHPNDVANAKVVDYLAGNDLLPFMTANRSEGDAAGDVL